MTASFLVKDFFLDFLAYVIVLIMTSYYEEHFRIFGKELIKGVSKGKVLRTELISGMESGYRCQKRFIENSLKTLK